MFKLIKINVVLLEYIEIRNFSKYKAQIKKFFETRTEHILLMELPTSGFLIPHNFFQTTYKAKYAFFLKNKLTELNGDNMSDTLIMGELAPKNFEELLIFIDEVSLI